MRSIIFDFDGVIANTFDTALAVSREMDGYPFTTEEYRALFDGNLFQVADRLKLPTFATDERRKQFARVYGTRISHQMLYSGMREVLESCSAHAPLYIVSSGGEQVIADFLKKTELYHHFSRILGFETASSKVEKFRMLGVTKTVSREHLFITDTLGDLREAAEIGMPSIAVSWGYHDVLRLERGGPCAIVDTPQQLLEAIARLGYTDSNA